MIWLVILGAAVITYALRSVFIGRGVTGAMSPRLSRALTLVAPAALAALVASSLSSSPSTADLIARTVALAVAGIVAWRTQHVLLTIGSGMAALWLVGLLG